ncbi:MAG: BMP family protein [Anaerolineae bacterium]
MRKVMGFLSLLVVITLLLSACAPAATPTPKVIKVGQVTDVGGIDDRSFNATAWKGVQDAIDQLGIEGKYLESQAQTDYAPNIEEFLREGYDLIVTVGFLLGDATAEAAKANPDTNFAIVDFAYDPTIPNVLGLTFATDEAAFLAGYVAAAMTKTGKVGTFGGIEIPPVDIFMVGFEHGIKYYNQQHGTNVELLGWDSATKTGVFAGNFESTDDGRRIGESLMDEGADIIMPVAGPVGLGTAAACVERGNCMIIGVDVDWTVSAPEYTSIILTSVEKRMDVAVFDAIKAVIDGTFEGGVYVGTLANDGVGISPFHEFDDDVPQEVKDELETIKQGIIDGTIDTGWPLPE